MSDKQIERQKELVKMALTQIALAMVEFERTKNSN